MNATDHLFDDKSTLVHSMACWVHKPLPEAMLTRIYFTGSQWVKRPVARYGMNTIIITIGIVIVNVVTIIFVIIIIIIIVI